MSGSPKFVSKHGEWTSMVVATAIRLWLTESRTLTAIANASHDDRWFLETARSILQGKWLGDYSQMTLIKGCGYPLWISLTSSTGLPLLLAQELLYVAACVAVVRAVAPFLAEWSARLALFLALLFNPMSLSDEPATRVTREGIYAALTLLVFAALVAAVRRADRPGRDLPWLLLGGLSLALFWHTREEGVWIVPLLISALVVLASWMYEDPKQRWKRATWVMAVPTIIFAGIYVGILVANGVRYGVFATVEFKQEAFVRAYGSLTRIRHRDAKPRLPVPAEARQRAYSVSPAFAELRPFLEGSIGAGWSTLSTHQGDLGGGWFLWAFRDAVAAAGYYERGGQAAAAFYDRLSREVNAARRKGLIDAAPPRTTLLPPLLPGQMQEIVGTWFRGWARLAVFGDFSIQPSSSIGSKDELAVFQEVTRTRLSPPESIVSIEMAGWALHVEGPLDMRIEGSDGGSLRGATLTRHPSEDVYLHLKARWKDFPPARHARFQASVPGEGALLILSKDGRDIERIELTPSVPRIQDPNIRMSFDEFNVRTVKPPVREVDRFRLSVLEGIGRAYQTVFPLFLILAAALYWTNVRWLAGWRGDWDVPILLAGALAAVATRILILSLIEVTSFTAMHGTYESPAHALLIVATAIMLHDGIIAARSRWSRRTTGLLE